LLVSGLSVAKKWRVTMKDLLQLPISLVGVYLLNHPQNLLLLESFLEVMRRKVSREKRRRRKRVAPRCEASLLMNSLSKEVHLTRLCQTSQLLLHLLLAEQNVEHLVMRSPHYHLFLNKVLQAAVEEFSLPDGPRILVLQQSQ